MTSRNNPHDMMLGLLSGNFTTAALKELMVDVMPIVSRPVGRKADLIDKLMNWMGERADFDRVYQAALAKFPKRELINYLHLHGHRLSCKLKKPSVIDEFKRLDCIPPSALDEARADPGPGCLALVPLESSPAGALVPADTSLNRLRKKWMKKARKFLIRKRLSKQIIAVIRECLAASANGAGLLINTIKQTVTEQVCDVSRGQRAVFFYKQVHKALVASRVAEKKTRTACKRKRSKPLLIVDARNTLLAEWRERRNMWAADTWQYKE